MLFQPLRAVFGVKEEFMNTGMRIFFVVMIGFALTVGIGCAPTLVSVSNPEIQTAGN